MSGRLNLGLFAAAFAICNAATALAVPVTASGPYHFRDLRSHNSIGLSVGDRLTYGATVIPNGEFDPPTTGQSCALNAGVCVPGSETLVVPFPQGGNVNEYSFSAAYDETLTGARRLTFTNGGNSISVDTNAVGGSVESTKLVKSMSLSGSGATPTFHWTVPASSTATRSAVEIWDLDHPSGRPTRILQQILPLTTNSFEVPDSVLSLAHNYSVAINLDERVGSTLISRSRSFFDFIPTIVAAPGEVPVFLPSVEVGGGPTGGPKYHFDVEVRAGHTIFVDPLVAVGYDYATGAGDPFFASVTLPDVGDGLFDLYLFDGTTFVFDTTLAAGVEHLFAADGVDQFRILGIEADAGLDPFNTTAFVTGLSFVADGSFTGTMTPIVQAALPEPGTFAVVGLGFLGMSLLRRRGKDGAVR